MAYPKLVIETMIPRYFGEGATYDLDYEGKRLKVVAPSLDEFPDVEQREDFMRMLEQNGTSDDWNVILTVRGVEL